MTTQMMLLVLIAVLLVADCIISARANRSQAQTFAEYAEEFINWIASMSLATVLIQRQMANRVENTKPEPEPEPKPEEQYVNSEDVFRQGIQNILDYGLDNAKKRRGDV